MQNKKKVAIGIGITVLLGAVVAAVKIKKKKKNQGGKKESGTELVENWW